MKRLLVSLLLLTAIAAMSCGGDEETRGAGAEGDDFVIGFSNPFAPNTFLKAIEDGTRAVIEAEGWTFKSIDAQLDPNKQISDIDTFVDQGVDAIYVFPLDARGLQGPLERAQAAGIKVFATNFEIDFEQEAPTAPFLDGQVLENKPKLAEDVVSYTEDKVGGSGGIGYIGLVIPVPSLEAYFEAVQSLVKETENLELLQRVDNPTDDTAGARPKADELITKWGDRLNVIMGYNDPSALGAALAATAAGRDDLLILGLQGQQEGVEGVRKGDIAATWDARPVEHGETIGGMIVAALMGAEESEWKRTILHNSSLVDESNVDEFVPWDQRIEELKARLTEGG